MSFYSETKLEAILKKYEKYWYKDQMNDYNLLKNLDVTYLSSNHDEQLVADFFKSCTYKIDDNDNVENKTLNINLLDKSLDNWKINIYAKLFELEYTNSKIKFNDDSYIIIDFSNEIYLLIGQIDKTGAIIDNTNNIALNKLLELNNHNVFGIEYMIYRSYQKLKNLNLSVMPTSKLELINSKELFKIKHELNLIDNLFKETNYSVKTETNKDDTVNYNTDSHNNVTTHYNIVYKLRYFINNYILEKESDIEKIILNTSKTPNNRFVINGDGKKIYMIGDIHADFPRFVQLLYNAKFINFEGPVWAKLNILDPNKIKEYMHSTDIFKEVVWLPNNVLLLSTGDLIDSSRSGGESDATGDYELRIHLLIFLLRDQAMKKESFVHFILGNHDRFLLQNTIVAETSKISVNKVFGNQTNRHNIIKNFYRIGLMPYAFIKYNNEEKYIFTAHGSLFFKLDFNEYKDFNLIENYKKLNEDGLSKLSKLDEVRDTINKFKNKFNFDDANDALNYSIIIKTINKITEITDFNTLQNNIKFIAEIIMSINMLLENKKNTKATDLFNAFKINISNEIKKLVIDIDNKTVDKFKDNIDDYFRKNKSDIESNLETYKDKVYLFIDNLNKLLFVTDSNYNDESISLKFIKETDPNIEYAVFGHQITTEKDFKSMILQQTGYDEHHTILSVCGCKLNFIDVALSEAFNSANNNFYELFHFENTKEPSRLRIYTSTNRYTLGAPLPADIYEYKDKTKLIPELKLDGSNNKF